MNVVFQDLPISEWQLEEIGRAQENDPLHQEVAWYCREGWPGKGQIKGPVKRYYPVSSEISIIDGLLMRNERLMIPSALQKKVLEKFTLVIRTLASAVRGPDRQSGGLDYLER